MPAPAPAPVPEPALSLSAAQTRVNWGESTLLTWSAQNAERCTRSGGWSGTTSLQGSMSTGTLNSSSTFGLRCTNAAGISVSESVTVTVNPLPAPTIQFSASKTTIAWGESTTLTWAAQNADRCVRTGSWSGTSGPQGTASTGILNSTSTFGLSCTNAAGTSVNGSVSVIVNSLPAPSIQLSASSTAITEGETVELRWSSQDAESCQARGGWSGSRNRNGYETSRALDINSDGTTATVAFTLECMNRMGIRGSDTVTVNVEPKPVVRPQPPRPPTGFTIN